MEEMKVIINESEVRLKIGRAVKRIRKDRNLTIKEVAEKISKGSDKLSNIENGKMNYKIDTLICLMNELGYIEVLAKIIEELGYEVDIKKKSSDI